MESRNGVVAGRTGIPWEPPSAADEQGYVRESFQRAAGLVEAAQAAAQAGEAVRAGELLGQASNYVGLARYYLRQAVVARQ